MRATGMVHHLLVALLMLVASGCAAQQGPRMPEGPLDGVPPPSAWLRVARSERLVAEGPRFVPADVERPNAATEPDSEFGAESDSGVDPEVVADPDVREIVVETSPLASFEAVARYELRRAEARRSRQLHPTRLLLRRSGPIVASRAARSQVNALLDRQHAKLRRCVLQSLAKRPEVLVTAPEALVLDQILDIRARQRRGRGLVHRFEVVITAGQPTEILDNRGDLDAAARACLAERVDEALGPEHRVDARLPVVVFTQRAHGTVDPRHQGLSREAAVLGWLHLERGEAEDALAFFLDAAWLLDLPEYDVLIGMAEQALGRHQAAAAAYGRYLDARPDAADAGHWARWRAELLNSPVQQPIARTP